jgi:hypothetical protein
MDMTTTMSASRRKTLRESLILSEASANLLSVQEERTHTAVSQAPDPTAKCDKRIRSVF